MGCESLPPPGAFAAPGALPLALVSFVGRARELGELRELMRVCRLVTLTGPGGIGKTRLALEVARHPAKVGVQACHIVDLTTVSDDTTLFDALAVVLATRETRHRSVRDSLVVRLGPNPALIALDNCEHVLDACVAAVGFLLPRCPLLRVMATSREPLGLPGETLYPVPPLPVPDPGEEGDLAVLAARDAVQLFADRAGPNFVLDETTAPAVAEICRRLDGVPLAIELAAARVGLLNPQEIASRLDDCFHLLTGGPRGAPARHRTLAAALEWSHGLLSPAERILFRRLSVFTGGFDLEAAEAVCPGTDIDHRDVLHLLGRLVAQSLVVCQPQASGTRYRLLETVRQFADERLVEAGEEVEVRAAHTAWCLAFAGRAEVGLTGREQASWLERLDREHANLMTAIELSLRAGQPAAALGVASRLVLFWVVRGRFREGLGVLDRCLAESVDATGDDRLLAQWGAGLLASMLGDFGRAARLAEDCRDLSRKSGNAFVEGRALNLLGFVDLFVDPSDACQVLEESLEPARRAQDRWCEASSLGLIGFSYVFRGDFAAAAPYFERCLAVSSASGDQQGLRMALIGTGYVAVERGDCRLARQALDEGLAIARRLEDAWWTAAALSYLCELGRLQGDHVAARRWGEEAVGVARQTGSPLLLGFCLSFDGRAAFAGLALPDARARLEEARMLPRGGGNVGNAAIASITLAEIAMASDDRGLAASLLDEGVALAQQSGDRLVIAAARLADARFARRFGDPGDAVARAHSALESSAALGHLPGIAAALDLLAGLAVADDNFQYAARLFGAASGLRNRSGSVCSPADDIVRKQDMARLAAALPAPALRAAVREGAALGTEEACAYARRGRGPRRRPSTGWSSLTPTEQQVVELAMAGLTNAEIGERLYVSPRTVQTHLAHVFVKLGVRSRRELTGAVPPDPGPNAGGDRRRTGASTSWRTDPAGP